MNKAFLAVGAAAALLLSACGAKDGEDASAAPPLAGATIGGPFTLTDQDGKPGTWDSFKGKYRIVYFGYTYCPDVCPVDLQKIMAGYRDFAKSNPERAARVQPIFITVDPERDTPAIIKDYIANFPPNLIGLTGTPEQIAAVAKSFAVVHGKEEEGSSTEYLVSHSRTPYLFGPEGEPIALIPVDNPATPEDEGSAPEIAHALAKWVR